jgi:succinate dehydrogenase/fumarate reductase iron-sulfur protein
MRGDREFLLRIQRFDPERGESPYLQEYSVSLDPSSTVLDALIKIKEDIDSSLTFRRSCRSAICGSCAVRVNDKGILACHTRLEEVAKNQDPIVIEPLRNFRVIKDLVVDMEVFFEKVKKIQPWLITAGYIPPHNKEHIVYPDEKYRQLNKVDNCILCAICYSDCPVVSKNPSFIGPVAAVKAIRFLLDSRDVAHRGRCQQVLELGARQCEEPEQCPVECPKEISLAEDVMKPLQKRSKKAVNSEG